MLDDENVVTMDSEVERVEFPGFRGQSEGEHNALLRRSPCPNSSGTPELDPIPWTV